MECTRCGACCVAPDIAALDKPLGVRCPYLGADELCTVYDDRPVVCRAYAADELCRMVEAPTLEERVARYLALFGLEQEAAGARAAGIRSMRAARGLAPAVGGAAHPGRRLPVLGASPGSRSDVEDRF